MRPRTRALICALLALVALAQLCVYAEIDLQMWVERYNQAAAQTGVYALDASEAEFGEDDTFGFALGESAYLTAQAISGADVDALSVEVWNQSIDQYAYMTTALAASDEQLGANGARDAINSFRGAFIASGSPAYYSREVDGWVIMLADMSQGVDSYIALYAIKYEVYPPQAGAAPGGFWDGLWGDEDTLTPDKQREESPVIHKI